MYKSIKRLLVYIIIYIHKLFGIKVDKEDDMAPVEYLIKYDMCDRVVCGFMTDKNIIMRHLILQTNIYNWAIYKVYNFPLYDIISILKNDEEHYIIKNVSFSEYNYNSQFQITILYYNSIKIDKILK